MIDFPGSLAPQEFSATPDRLPALIERYETDHGSLSRLLCAPFSSVRRERMRRFLSEWAQALEQMPFDALTRADRADWLLLRWQLVAEGRELDQEERVWAETAPLLPFAASLIALEESRLALEDVEPVAAAETLDRAARQVREIIASFQDDTQCPCAAERGNAVRILAQIQPMLEAWFRFYHGYDPLFTWWVEKPYAAFTHALAECMVFLRQPAAGENLRNEKKDQEEAILGSPIGREALLEELRTARIGDTPEELIAAGHAEMHWCRREFVRAARDMGQGEDWRAALELVKQGYVAPGRQPALVRDLAREAMDYVEAEDLLTVPPLARETWRMAMMSPERQKINPFFLGGEQIVVSFPTHDMEQAQKRMSLRGNNRAFARATVQHELVPGHHLQAFYQDRCWPYRQLFYTPFWTEGWTLHWEMLLWERGFARTPEERIGMLFWRQHRAARVLFSLAYHLGQMTAQECVAMLVDEAGHERDNALAEVRRSFEGGYDPLYQCAYLIGGLQMHALYGELVGGGRLSARAFHDAVMRENCMPLTLLRALLTEEPLERSGPADWRFLGTIKEREPSFE